MRSGCAIDASPGLADLEALGQRHVRLIRQRLRHRWRGSPLRSWCDDAVQEVLLECVRVGGALSRLDPRNGAGLVGLLRGVVDNVAARVERRRARQCSHLDRRTDPERLPAADTDPGTAIDRQALHCRITAALHVMDAAPPVDGHSLADLLRLHFVDEMPIRKIAELWGLQSRRAHELRRRACRRLRHCLGGPMAVPERENR